MPLIEKFSSSSSCREWGAGRQPDSDASATPGDDGSVESADDGRPDRGDDLSVEAAPGGVRLQVGGETRELSRAAVEDLREALGEALTDTREFVHTVGRHREDGAYVVERRGADSAGHRKVFDSLAACRSLYEELPAAFAATDLDAPGVSGGRRHMLAWHFVEHPAFDCELASRQPLTVRKCDTAAETATTRAPSGEVRTVADD